MKSYLNKIKSKEDLKELFIEKWNWDNPSLSAVFYDFSDEINKNVEKIEILAEKLNYKVLFCKIKDIDFSSRHFKSFQKKIINDSQIKQESNTSIFIFSSDNFEYIDFVNIEKLGPKIQLRRFSITPETKEKLRTPTEQLQILKLDTQQISFSYIKNKVENAFSIDLVTEKFFKEYIKIFNKIREFLKKQKIEKRIKKKEGKIYQFIHQLFNRIMFIYFVQKKECLGKDKNFIANFWDKYKDKYKGKNKFHKNWLNVLFFEALSQPSWLYKENNNLEKFNQILKAAPYLNGGLFDKKEFDRIGWFLDDDLFDDIFDFFESYNFTVEESTPFEIDIAINPEMLGNIYEHLVNIKERADQPEAGVFYTPKTEIELMIRRSLTEFLYGKTKIKKDKIYQFIFKEYEEEIKYPFKKNEAENILKELEDIIMLDPACGSGHYLVVAAQILYKLKNTLQENLKIKHLDRYEEKKKIIERNIYGSDIKRWAVEIAKLRLWLDLFVDAEIRRLRNLTEPLLPNLGFKIRCGDSIVQRIGDQIIALRRLTSIFSKKKLEQLSKRKEYVYEKGDNDVYKETIATEKKIFRDSLKKYEIKLKKKLEEYEKQKPKEQIYLFGESRSKQLSLTVENIDSIRSNLKDINKLREVLKKHKEPPMIWDLAFAEVFAKKGGFDIVIANPPYVRQEDISDLNGSLAKKKYKDKLIEQTKKDWSYDFNGDSSYPKIRKIDRRSDLYIYFYFKGLKLLNSNGILCYISSNSWLDVGYGSCLQEILLKNVPVVSIYDNQAKRSFKHADVNTIIIITKSPLSEEWGDNLKDNIIKFIMFKEPFDKIMFSENFIDIEKRTNFKKYPEGEHSEKDYCRIHSVKQKDLFSYGKDKKTGKYSGNKWGGKYLRAPEIYWKILEKGKNKFVRLGDIAKVRRGFTTGANEFFYLKDVTNETIFSDIKNKIKNLGGYKTIQDIKKNGLSVVYNKQYGDYWLLEKRFLKPVITTYRDSDLITISPDSSVFLYPEVDYKTTKYKANDYVKWGEKLKTKGRQKQKAGIPLSKIKSLKGKKYWYSFTPSKDLISCIFWQKRVGERFAVFHSINKTFADQKLYPFVEIDKNIDKLIVSLNSIIQRLLLEIEAISYTGAYTLIEISVEDVENLLVINPDTIKINLKKYLLENKKFQSIFDELGINSDLPVESQKLNISPECRKIDNIIFDILGLSSEERENTYKAVVGLVKNRLEKSKSV